MIGGSFFGEAYPGGSPDTYVAPAIDKPVVDGAWASDWDTTVEQPAVTAGDTAAGDDTSATVTSTNVDQPRVTDEAIADDSQYTLTGPPPPVVTPTAPPVPTHPRIPVCVSVRSRRMFRDITASCRELSYRSTAPGGYASLTVDLDRPLLAQGDDLAEFATVRVTDARHGGVLWEGLLEDPGRSDGPDGQTWRLAALGGSSMTRDVNAPYIGIDSSLANWILADDAFTEPYATHAIEGRNDTGNSHVLNVPQGTTFLFADTPAGVIYQGFQRARQNIGCIQVTTQAGFASASHEFAISAGFSGILTAAFSTTAIVRTFRYGSEWAALESTPVFAWRYTGGTTTAGPASWAAYGTVHLRPVIYDKAGAAIDALFYQATYVTAGEIIEDLLGGGRLPLIDGANAAVAAAGAPFRYGHLAYHDPVTAEQILSDLMLQEPGFYWAIWESGADGKYRFEWTPWPTTVRYEAGTDDGFDSPGSVSDLYNAVTVRYRDSKGVLGSERVTSTVAALNDVGLVREHALDLGDNVTTSDTEATTAGTNFLTEHSAGTNAGRLTVARPILDRVEGRMVGPHEIRPGSLVDVRGVRPSKDSINTTGRDGVTTFRVAAVEYRASTGEASLELDSYSRSTAQAIAALAKNRITRRR